MPILFSIATVRHQCPNSEIFIFDFSSVDLDWKDYESRLGFEVVKSPCYLDRTRNCDGNSIIINSTHYYGKHLDRKAKHCCYMFDIINAKFASRFFDFWGFVESRDCDRAYFVDSDIFFLSPPLGYSEEPSLRADNTGLFRCNPKSSRTSSYFDYLLGISSECFRSFELRRKMMGVYGNYGAITDEVIHRYLSMVDGDYPWRYREMSPEEHFLPHNHRFLVPSADADVASIQAIHSMMYMTGKERGRLGILLRESWEAIRRFFSFEEIHGICGNSTFNRGYLDRESFGSDRGKFDFLGRIF